ncbi:hypothetical protein L9F63_021679, partial [Diploptera punctata]
AENDLVKKNLEDGVGSSLTSGTDAKVEDGSAADDKTITEGDDIYEDDWEEDSDKRDSDNKTAEKDDIETDIEVTKEEKWKVLHVILQQLLEMATIDLDAQFCASHLGLMNSLTSAAAAMILATSSGAVHPVKKIQEDQDSRPSSSFCKLDSETNERGSDEEKLEHINNQNKFPLQLLNTDFFVQTMQTQKVSQNISRCAKKKAQEKIQDTSVIPVIPCDKVCNKTQIQQANNLTKCVKKSAQLETRPCQKIHGGEYEFQIGKDKISAKHVKPSQDNCDEVNKKLVTKDQLKNLSVSSNLSKNESENQVYEEGAMIHNFPYRKSTKCPPNVESSLGINVTFSTNYGKYRTVPCVTDRNIMEELPSPVETISVSTSPIDINVTDRQTSVSSLMAANAVERETSPLKISYLEAATSPLSLPPMIDEQLSSANLPADNLIDVETSPIPSVECISKSTSPIRNFIPEKMDKGTSITYVSKNFTDSETSSIQSEVCVCKSTSPTNILLPEKLDKSTRVTCVSRNFADKGTSTIHYVEAICGSTSTITIPLVEKVDKSTSITGIVPERMSAVSSIEYVCEDKIPLIIPPREKPDKSFVSISEKCSECNKLIPKQILVTNREENLPKNSERNKEILSIHDKSVEIGRKLHRSSIGVQTELNIQPIKPSVDYQKKNVKLKWLACTAKQYDQDSHSELSDEEPCGIKSLSHGQMIVSEGELPLSCSICSQDETENISASLTKSTATNVVSVGEVFSCQCFEGYCTCSEGEVATDNGKYKHHMPNVPASQKKISIQLLNSSSVDSSERSQKTKACKCERTRTCKDCPTQKICCTDADLTESSEELSDGQILCFD